MSTAAFYSLSTVCQYLTLYRLLILCHYAHCYILQSVHCLSVPHTVPSVVSVSLCPLLSSTFPQLSANRNLFADCHQTADYPAAVTHSADSEWGSDKHEFKFCDFSGNGKRCLLLLSDNFLWEIICTVLFEYLVCFLWEQNTNRIKNLESHLALVQRLYQKFENPKFVPK